MPFAVRSIPLLAIPTLIYMLLAPMGAEGVRNTLAGVIFAVTLPSGDVWAPQWGHLLLTFSAFLLFFEIVRSSKPVNTSIVENSLSFLLFTFQLIMFLLVAGFGTMDFVMIMGMTMLDFTAGAMVMIAAARRDVAYHV